MDRGDQAVVDQGDQTAVDWGDQTVVDQDVLESYIFELDSNTDFKLEIINYEIEIDQHGMRKRNEFLYYLKNQTPKFIFSKPKREEIRQNGGWPYDKARRKIGNISNKSDGFYGELLLYLVMEGFFDFPLVSHKMAVKEDYNTQVKGADGLYIGTFDGDEVIGLGEAKFYEEKSNAVNDAIEGITEYHGPEGIDEREAELDVAREHISDDLDKEEVEQLIDRILHLDRSTPIIHPVLIAYEGGDYSKLKTRCETREQAIKIIEEFHEREEFLEIVKRRIDQNPKIRGIQLLVLFLRVKDTRKFKNDLEGMI